MRLGLFFGSSTGATAWAAELVRAELGEELVSEFGDVRQLTPERLADFDLLILGAPTWYAGELQEDWAELLERLEGGAILKYDVLYNVIYIYICMHYT